MWKLRDKQKLKLCPRTASANLHPKMCLLSGAGGGNGDGRFVLGCTMQFAARKEVAGKLA